MTDNQDDSDYDPDVDSRYVYDVLLCVEHPAEPPDRITAGFGLAPDACRPSSESAGDVVWSHAIRIAGRRLFFRRVIELMARLEAAATYLTELQAGGGRVTIWIRLPGDTNIGDVLDAKDVLRLSLLNVELGVEVLPSLRNEPATRLTPPRELHA